MQNTAHTAIYLIRSNLLTRREYITLPVPINIANIKGPIRSPTVLETLSPLSANADAHWLIATSAAPPVIIIIIKTHMILCLKSAARPSPAASSEWLMGTCVKNTALTSGSIAQSIDKMRQLDMPNMLKNTVDTSITKAVPQQ